MEGVFQIISNDMIYHFYIVENIPLSDAETSTESRRVSSPKQKEIEKYKNTILDLQISRLCSNL